MEKKFSWLLALTVSMVSFAMTACGNDDDFISEDYYINDVLVKTNDIEQK